MKGVQARMLAIIILFSLFPLSQTRTASAIEFSSTEFWFYVNEPTIISYPDMEFMMGNNADDELLLVCDYEEIDGININVYLEWDNITISPHERVLNRYSIEVIDFLAVTIDVIIHCGFINPSDSDNKVSSAGSVLNHIVFYDEISGSELDLRIQDQSGSPRNSTIEIIYQPEPDKPFSPIKFLNETSSYKGILPHGRYQIFARDIQSGIWGEKIIDLVEDTKLIIELALVGFNRFMLITNTYMFRGENVTTLGLNVSINNFVETLYEVRVYGELFDDKTSTSVSITNVEYRSELLKTTNFGLVLWFELFDWRDATYTVSAYIFSYDKLIAHREVEFRYTIDNQRTEHDTYSIIYMIPLIITVSAILYRKRVNHA